MRKRIILLTLLSGTFISISSLDGLSFGAGSAYAQSIGPVISSADTAKKAEKTITFSADVIEYHNNEKLIIAKGNVTLYQNGKHLKADQIIYDRKAHQVTATGNVTIRNENGDVMFMDDTKLTDDLSQGFIHNIRMLFSDGSHLVAKEGIRKGTQTKLKNAAYSPCKVCNEDGKRKPLWQITAQSVTHDEVKKVITYKNVLLQIAGVPILYTPYFSHPDPTVHSASGLLVPEFATSSELGLNVTLPYYFYIDQDKDLTLEPLLTSKEGLVMAGTYRQHTGNGKFFVKGSVTNAIDRDVNQIDTGKHEIRGHVFSEGKFDLDNIKLTDDQWQWDYAIRWVSDDTYLRRYYQDRSDTLQSHVKIEDFASRSYFTAGVYGFQGLEIEDKSGTTGHALPAFDLNIAATPGIWGNQFLLNASGVALVRSNGLNSQRISIEGKWKLPLKSNLGDFYTITASVRGNVFHISNADKQDQPIYGGRNDTYGKILPEVSIDWKLPFIQSSETTQHIIEPLVSIIVAPNKRNTTDIVNEDSRSFEFDEINLFSHNRYNGYDRWEAGTRVNYGVRYSLYSPLTTVVGVFGQSFRLNNTTDTFPIGSGYRGRYSDFVGRLDVTVGDYIDYTHRFRLDKDSLNLRRNEMILSGGTKKIRASVRYIDLDRGTTDLTNTELQNRKEIGLGMLFHIQESWTVKGNWVRDILTKETISYNAGIGYRNDCLDLSFRFERRLTTDRDITPSSTFYLRLTLKNIG